MSNTDRIRVLRLIEYVGERHFVELEVKRSLHGSRFQIEHGRAVMQFSAITLGEFPESPVVADKNGELIERITEIAVGNSLLAENKLDLIVQQLEVAGVPVDMFKKQGLGVESAETETDI